MTETPCTANPDLWFSDAPKDVEAAKDGCLDCPLSRFNACQERGWRHEFGVFGGLSPDDRKAIDPKRYALALHLAGKTGEEIAEVFGISRSGASSWVAQAKRREALSR